MDLKLHNADTFSLSNIGFVDGLFHIQMKAALRNHTLTDGKYAYQKHVLGRHDNHSDIVYVEYKDGTIIELAESSIHTYQNESTLIFGNLVMVS